MCRLTWSSSSLAVLTRGPRTQRLQPNHVIFVSKSSRRINYTQETAEPLGVSPPEAVDLLLIKTGPGFGGQARRGLRHRCPRTTWRVWSNRGTMSGRFRTRNRLRQPECLFALCRDVGAEPISQPSSFDKPLAFQRL